MQGTHDMTLELQPIGQSQSPTTSAGADAWLAGTLAEPSPADVLLSTPEAMAPDDGAVQQPVGPVNAAESLALALAQETFSSARKLVGPDGAELIVDPERDVYYFESTSLKPLNAVLQQPASAWTPVYSEAVNTARAANAPQPLERLRWYAGLIATPGILSRKLDRDGRHKLSGWPETEREFPRHFRIAKEMLKQPATADEITSASGMSYEQVVDYINASFAAGRLQPTVDAKAPKTTTRAGRLMARLNKPLFSR